MPQTVTPKGLEPPASVSAGRLVRLGLVLFLGAVLGCPASRPAVSGPDPDDSSGPVWFEDVTDSCGLNFVHDPGPLGSYFMPQSMGSGCAFLDLQGRLGIYLLHNGGPEGKKNQLFRQKPDGNFEDVSRGSGLDVAGFSLGVAVGDVNNDGLP